MIGKGIAIAGIWIGVGLIGLGGADGGGPAAVASIFAFLATAVVCACPSISEEI